ncbi:hypothetical protein C8F04DRAFT_1025163 [Mycena alexandri]|uniref:Uncharacterized protein n=1 Tax=Mycena alexandri TaxID=1745969 RepID=A0AAD6XEX7_9AGAR|nr:hypothetical protein C8F04DRAFT_1025163 [Mycena alexandri]
MSLAVGTRSVDDAAPLPLSFPSILRNPGIASRFAYLSDSVQESSKPLVPKKHKTLRTDNEGRRWIRRKENARFTGNVHIVQPAKRDFLPPQGPQIRSTFPEPLPVYLARNNKVPTAATPSPDPRSIDCGRFSLGLRGMRRDLRKMGFRSKLLVLEIETAVVGWLEAGGTLLLPDASESDIPSSGTPIGTTGVVEVSRTPLQLIWKTDESFARYVVHCTARYHKIVSFSKEVTGQRLTYLLRPNVNYPGHHSNAALGIDTPPTTDLELSSQLDTDSEFASDLDTRSEAGESVADSVVDQMSTIDEDAVTSPHPPPALNPIEDEWSEVGDVDTDGDESAMGQSVNSLAEDPDATMVVESRLSQLSLRARTWEHAAQNRSSSSPSRSPVRPPRRSMPAAPSIRPTIPPKSFYEYLFS